MCLGVVLVDSAKVLHVITGLNRGGAETMLCKLLTQDQGLQRPLAVVSMTDRGLIADELEAAGIPVHVLGAHRNMAATLPRLRRILRSIRPNIVHAWMYHACAATTIATLGMRPQPKLVWGIRHTPNRVAKERLRTRATIALCRWLSSRADSVLYNACKSKAVHEALGYSSSHSHVIPNGFDAERFSPDRDTALRTREMLSVSESDVVIGTVSRDHPVKGIDTLIDAATKLVTHTSRLVFVLIGRGFTPENTHLRDTLLARGIASSFRLLGERSDIPAILRGLDIFVLPSRSEAFPNALGEAMLCGIPCVATDVGDVAAILNSYGVLVPSDDAQTLADGISSLVEMDERLRRDLGRESRAWIQREFALSSITQQYRELYEMLVR